MPKGKRVTLKSGKRPVRPAPVRYRRKDETDFLRAARHLYMPEIDALIRKVKKADDAEATRLVQQFLAPSRDRGAYIDGITRARASRMKEYSDRRWRSVLGLNRKGDEAVGRALGSWEVRERSRLHLAVGDTRRRIQSLAVLDKDKMLTGLRKERGIAFRRVRSETRQGVQHAQSEINRARQEAVGVKSYIWRTAEDERVRDSHRRLNRTVRLWSSSPVPGQEANCRCTAQPNVNPPVVE